MPVGPEGVLQPEALRAMSLTLWCRFHLAVGTKPVLQSLL